MINFPGMNKWDYKGEFSLIHLKSSGLWEFLRIFMFLRNLLEVPRRINPNPSDQSVANSSKSLVSIKPITTTTTTNFESKQSD